MEGSSELGALAERAGGRERLLLVAERRDGEAPPRALLEGFARDLFGEAGATAGPRAGPRAGPTTRPPGARRWPWCPLAFVLWRPGAGSTAGRRRLRELVRDVRGQLAPGAALVAVLVRDDDEEEAEEARRQLEGLLRRACARRPPALPDEALQAALYRPGSPQGAAPVRAAAARALRAALQPPPDGVETEKPRLPAFLRCLPWGRRSQKTTGCLGKPADASSVDDGLQEAEEGVALTNLAPNGNCEEVCGGAGS